MKKNISEKYSSNYSKEAEKIDKKLAKILESKKPKSLYEPCSYILQSGGKHLRSYLVLLTAKAVGGKFSQAYNAALSVEILHNFTLVHDDIMDSADKRRGRETLHIKYDISTIMQSIEMFDGMEVQTNGTILDMSQIYNSEGLLGTSFVLYRDYGNESYSLECMCFNRTLEQFEEWDEVKVTGTISFYTNKGCWQLIIELVEPV